MSIYKNLGQDDTTSFKTNLYEQIPVTGTIISGTYGTFPSESNIKYFQTMITLTFMIIPMLVHQPTSYLA